MATQRQEQPAKRSGVTTTTSTSNESADRAELERLKAENRELRRQIGEFQRADADRALTRPANSGPAETNHVVK